MIEFGFFALCLGFVLALYALSTSAVALYKPYVGLVASSRNAILGVFTCVLVASLVMWYALLFHDFSVRYVYLNSAVNMPPVYLFTAFWGALEGSHLLWTLCLSSVTALAIVTVRKGNEALYPALCFAFSLPLVFMLGLNISISAPFDRLFPVGEFGKGLNALLQNPYMAIHPPMLFTGYSLLVVPFAYGFAALVKGRLTADWLPVVRSWALVAWGILSVAIFLGGKWAYVELGWGGYWAWDPVENSSFMPWLALGALLHTILIYDKLQSLPRLLVFLSMVAFVLTFQGTFITRSGVVSSVHSFAESNIGPVYLTWIVTLLSLTLGLLFTRGSKLMGQPLNWRLSKGSMLLCANYLFLFLLALVLTGTLLPLIVEAIQGTRISIQQPFFNAFMPWLGFGFVFFIALANVMRWKNGKIESPLYSLLFPLLWAVVITTALKVQKHLDWKSVFIYVTVFWSALVLLVDFLYKFKNMRWQSKTLLKYNRPYLGSLIVHLGFLMAVLGFSGNYRAAEADVNLNLHQSTSFYGYTIQNDGLGVRGEYNAQYVYAKLKATNERTGETVMIYPMRSKFTNNEQWFNEVGVHSTLWFDLYTVLASFDVTKESIALKINYNPTVKLVWTSLLVMLLGALVSASHRLQKRSYDSSLYLEEKSAHWARSLRAALFISVFILIILFGFSGSVYAQEKKEAPPVAAAVPTQVDSKLADVAKELRCPTCLGMSVLESYTPQSNAMRLEIEQQLDQGKSKKEIISYFKERYGEWILREPDASSPMGFVIWLIPILGLALGPFVMLRWIRAAERAKERERESLREEIKRELRQQIERLRS